MLENNLSYRVNSKLYLFPTQKKKKKKKPTKFGNQLPKLKFRGCLVVYFEQQFLIFKQYYMYFHTFFHPHVFPQNNNDITINGP